MIVSSRPFLPWILALLVLVVIEATFLIGASPERFTRNNFLQYRFGAPESLQRLFVQEKIEYFSDTAPTILQIGDSSGLYGIQPAIIESHLPGYRYLNFGIATNLGYCGYYRLAQYMLRRNPSIKYLVLYTTFAAGQPRASLWCGAPDLLADDINSEFVNPIRRAFQLPTLSLREQITHQVYYSVFGMTRQPRSQNYAYLMFHDIIRMSGGWARETDNPGDRVYNLWVAIDSLRRGETNPTMPPDVKALFEKAFPITDYWYVDWLSCQRRSYIDLILGEFAALARRHNTKLVVIINPMPESIRTRYDDTFIDLGAMETALQRFGHANPEVAAPTQFDYWPDSKFSTFSHVVTPHARENSDRVGRILAKIVSPCSGASRLPPWGNPGTIVRLDFGNWFTGYGWTDPLTEAGTDFRRLNPGRKEGLVFLAVRPGTNYKLRLHLCPEVPDVTVTALTAAVHGRQLQRTGHGTEEGLRFVDWLIPSEAVERYNGWLEALISTRGMLDWQDAVTNDEPIDRSLAVNRLTVSAQ
jgi:hypothetical protein